jgi:hypothetical protein
MRFHLAGLEVEVIGDVDHMAGYYDRCPPTARPIDLTVEIERRPGFAESRQRGPSYPAFERSTTPAGARFSRFDAEGEIDRDARHARFVVGESPNSLEAAVRIAVASALPRVGAVILHASGIERGGRAQLFAGISGAGKSTIAALLAGGDVHPISDELVIATCRNNQASAIVTPFIGSTGLPHGERFELAAIHFLVQAPEHRRRRLERVEALPQLLRHVVSFATEPSAIAGVMDLAAALLDAVDAFELRFAPRADVAAAIGLT